MPNLDNAGENIINAFVDYTYRDLGDPLHAEMAVQNHLLPVIGHLKGQGVDMDLPNYASRRRLVDNYAVDTLRRYDLAATAKQAEEILKETFSPDAIETLFATANNPKIFGNDYPGSSGRNSGKDGRQI